MLAFPAAAQQPRIADVSTALQKLHPLSSGITAAWWIAPICALIALAAAFICYHLMIKAPKGNARMEEIAGYVREGAMAYLKQQYSRVGLVFIILFIIFLILALCGVQNPFVPVAFLTGGFFSGLAGFFGMKTATYASARTANAARKGLDKGLKIAFRSGAVMGLIVAAIMGFALTLPISSAAIGISINLSGVAAGAAVVGCCCHMMGYAAMSFRENRWGGAVAQGLGTSMLQVPNLFRKPVLFLPPVISSAILGMASTLLPNGVGLGLIATKTGSGMGTAGLVGPIDMLFEMLGAQNCNVPLTLLWVALFCFVLPAALTLGIGEIFRKTGIMKYGDLKLQLK